MGDIIHSFKFKFNASDLDTQDNNVNYYLDCQEYNGFKFELGYQMYMDDEVDDLRLIFMLKVYIPKELEQAKIKYDYVINDINGNDIKLSNITSNIYENEHLGGPGPHSQSNSILFSNINIESRIFYVHLRIYQIITKIKKVSTDKILWRLKEKLLPPEMTELNELRIELNKLEKIIIVVKRREEFNHNLLSEIKKEISEQKQIHSDFKSKSHELREQNKKFRNEINNLQSQIINLNKQLEEGNIDNFLRNFDESKVQFNDFTIMELKSILTNILKLQSRISHQIIEEELCAICMENRRDLALDPCGHLYICQKCEENLLSQKNKVCPICMTPFKSTLKVKF